jgi:PleD family two-component response regulator
MQRADRILKDIENTNISLSDGRQLKVSLSTGIVSSIRITASTETDNIIQHVIEAVAHAKRNGGNQSHTVFI